MIRAAALTVVLILVGSPAATAACLVTCGSSSSSSVDRDSAILRDQGACDQKLVATPAVREDGSRERVTASPAGSSPLTHRTARFNVERTALMFAASPEHALLSHKPPSVLRI